MKPGDEKPVFANTKSNLNLFKDGLHILSE